MNDNSIFFTESEYIFKVFHDYGNKREEEWKTPAVPPL